MLETCGLEELGIEPGPAKSQASALTTREVFHSYQQHIIRSISSKSFSYVRSLYMVGYVLQSEVIASACN